MNAMAQESRARIYSVRKYPTATVNRVRKEAAASARRRSARDKQRKQANLALIQIKRGQILLDDLLPEIANLLKPKSRSKKLGGSTTRRRRYHCGGTRKARHRS